MPIIVTYTTHTTFKNSQLVMRGAFKTKEHYEKFAKIEAQRPCYQPIPFTVNESVVISHEEYERLTQNMHGGC